MSYPYPPMGGGEQPQGGQPGGWGGTPPQGGYGPSGPDWQHQETMAGGTPMGPPPMGPPPMQPPMAQPPMGQYPMGPPPGPKKNNGVVIIAAVVTALVVVGGALVGAYYAAANGGDDNKPAAVSTPGVVNPGDGGGQTPPSSTDGQNRPGYYHATKSWSLWDPLNTASGDSKPMSLNEVFGEPEAKSQNNSIENITMTLQGTGRLDSDCGSAVWGADLKSALQTYGCTQVVRAVYVSSDQKWVGQLAIFNLRDVNAANTLIQDLDPKVGNKGFYLPVAGQPPADKFGRGSTGASGGAYGHFVVIGWAGHADGSAGDNYGTDTIAPSSLVERAGKEFLFSRNIR